VQRTGDITHATSCGVPASTARGWLARETVEVTKHNWLFLHPLDTTATVRRELHRKALRTEDLRLLGARYAAQSREHERTPESPPEVGTRVGTCDEAEGRLTAGTTRHCTQTPPGIHPPVAA
jgi:hypothetical protein